MHGVSGSRGRLGYLVQQAWFPSDELRVAQALVPNRRSNVPMRIMNVAGCPVSMPVEAVLVDLEAVEAARCSSDSAREESEGRAVARDASLEIAGAQLARLILQYRPRLEVHWALC